MPAPIGLLLTLLALSPLLFYASLVLVRLLDFHHQAHDLAQLHKGESRFVWRIASSCLPRGQRLPLFSNLNSLCRVLSRIAQHRRQHPEEKELCLALEAKLYQRCTELDHARVPSYHQPYSHTSELPPGLEVELFFKASRGNGYSAQILEQSRKGIIISYPSCNPVNFGKPLTNWRGQPVLLCFSHREAGIYRFASEFDRDYFDRHFTTLRILHSNSFVLIQKRQKQRHKVHLRAWADLNPQLPGKIRQASLYSGAKVPLTDRASLQCTITELSCSGLRVDFQEKVYCQNSLSVSFSLLGNRITLSGRVCSSQYYHELNHTSVGVELQELSPYDQQQLGALLYGPDRVEDAEEDMENSDKKSAPVS